MAGPIRISILANASQAKRELNGVAGATSSLGSKFAKFGKMTAAGVAIAGAAAVKFGVDSVKAASDAQQSLGATETVFGKFAKGVIKSSDEAANKYGLSANSYRENANLIGSLLKNQGVSLDQLAGSTDKMISKASDLAATFGGTTTDAVEALSSALKGEFDPLERYGISLKASTVSAAASAAAQKKYGKSLDDLSVKQQTAVKQQATAALINKQSSDSAGAFARETGTLAHQQQVLGAQFENVKVKVGNVLLPVLTKAFSYVNTTVIPAVENFGARLRDTLAPVVDRIKQGFSDLMVKLEPVGTWLAAHPELIKGAGIALGIAAVGAVAFAAGMGLVALATSPITLTILAIAALGAGFAYAYKNSETFRNGVQAIITAFQNFVAAVTPIVQQIVATVVGKFRELQPQMQAIWASIQGIVRSALSIVKSVIQIVTGVIKGIWQNFGGTILRFITTTMTNIANLVKSVFKIIQGVFKVFSSLLKGDWSGLWSGIKMIVSGAIGVVKAILSQAWNVIRTVASAAWTALKLVVSKAWEGIKSAVSKGISGVVGFVKGLPGKILSALGNLGSLLVNAGKQIIQGLLDGIGSMIGSVKSKLSELTNLIPDWKGPRDKDKKLLRPAGRLIIKGLVDGFQDGFDGVEKSLGKLTDSIGKILDDRLAAQRARLKKNLKGDAETRALKAAEKASAVHRRAILKGLRDEQAAIKANGRAQDQATEKLGKARDALKSLREESNNYASSIKQSFVNFGSVIGLGQQEDGSVGIRDLISQLKDKLIQSQRFAALIRQLTVDGLSGTAIQQLLDAGVEGGLATAEAIASGGTAAIKEINSLQQQIAKQGGSLGDTMADNFYGAGLKAAEGLVAGLEKMQDKLDRAAERMADALVKAVKKALGIHSPSRVFAGVGDQVVKGLAIGLDETYVKRAGTSLADSLQKGFGTPALDAYSAQVTASSQNKLTVTLTADQVSQLQRGREIQMDLDAYKAAGGRARA